MAFLRSKVPKLLRLAMRFRKLLGGHSLLRHSLFRRRKVGRQMPMRSLLKLLRKTYGLKDPTHNQSAAWKFPTTKTTSRAILKLAKSLTYGELHPRSVDRAIRFLNLRKDDVFVDLGSGTGKVVIQAAMQSDCKRLIGIEVLHQRNVDAKRAHANLKKSMPRKAHRIEFIEDSFLNVNLSDVTVVYMANHVFDDPLPGLILEMLKTLPRLRAVMCMKELCPKHTARCHKLDLVCAYFYSRFERVLKEPCEVSWSKGSQLIVYKLRE